MVPKFRAWDKDSKVMRSWKDLILTKDDGDDFWLIGYKENACITSFDHDQTLMQSTEMDDKTGKEIWHKDILDESYTSPLNGEEVIVRYIVEKENGMWRLKDWKGRQQYDRYLFMRNNQCIKIGNAFENPELLEQAHEN